MRWPQRRLRRAGALLQERPHQLVLGAVVAGLAGSAASTLLVVAAALALAASAVVGAARRGALLAVLLVLAGWCGQVRLEAIDAPAAGLPSGAEIRARAHLLERPRSHRFGTSAVVRLVSGRWAGAKLLARAGPAVRWPAPRRAGVELRVRGLLRSGSALRVGGGTDPARVAPFDREGYLRARGAAAELWLTRLGPTGRRRGGVAGTVDALRARAERGVMAGLEPRHARLLAGMVLGQDERIAQSTKDDWRAAGLAHLLAVSGQNVMLLGALSLPLLAAAGLGLRVRFVALLALIVVYIPLAGGGPALQRAGAMGAAGITAMALSRPASGWYALLLAAALTLALDPRAWTHPGWQLSFVAVGGILWLRTPLRSTLAGVSTALFPASARPEHRLAAARAALAALALEGTAITIVATLATAPLLAHHFGAVPLAGLPANLLALPAVPIVMWLGMLKAACGVLAAAGPPLDAAGGTAAHALGALAAVPLGYLAALAESFAALPTGAVARMSLGSPVAVVAAYAALFAGVMLARRLCGSISDRAQEAAGAWRRTARSRRRAVVAMTLAGAVALGARALAPPSAPGELTVRFLDVGQGDATLIQDPSGHAILFDGGPPEAGIARLLRRAGVRSLTAVVATHASRDHHGGLPEVLARFPVGVLIDGGDGSRADGFRRVVAEAARRGVRSIPGAAPLTFRAGVMTVRVLSPAPRPPGPAPEDPNPRALVALVSSGDFDLLLSADAESDSLLPLTLPDVEAMKVPHHGSADPGLPALLERLRPELAAIEVGDNRYGHPTASTLAALRRARVRTYRTDRDGTVTLTVGERAANVSTER